MTLYTYLGSIPTTLPKGVTEDEHLAAGWIVAPDKPDCPEGKEVVWLNWEWVIRDPKPDNNDGFVWKWNHDAMQWIEYKLPPQPETPSTSIEIPSIVSTEIGAIGTTQLSALTPTQISSLSSTQLGAL